MSTRIDHAAEAERLRELAFEYELAHPTSDNADTALVSIGAVANGYANAQVHATLALVDEQRTANLIAYVAQAQILQPGERLSAAEEADLALVAATAREGLWL